MKTIKLQSGVWIIPGASLLLILLPLLGALMTDVPAARYLEFPPRTLYVAHAAFAWPAFIGLTTLIVLTITPFVIRMLRAKTADPGAPPLAAPASAPAGRRRFPGWGWCGLAFGAGAWLLAWTRFDWFAPWQEFTFSPLWFGYIVVINALTYRRTGQCMLTSRPGHLLRLLAASAGFWWMFEYLNRFVQNWHYVGIGELTAWEYFIFATLPFATVLPAVLGTFELLATFPRLRAGLTGFCTIPRATSKGVARAAIIIAAASLAGIGVWPDYLFPTLWLAPFGLLAGLQSLTGKPGLLDEVARGDWRRVVLLALAALVCGLFWEMWNIFSMAKWIYAVPFVNRFHIFEMPVLGYAGYLPFGLECALIADLLGGQAHPKGK